MASNAYPTDSALLSPASDNSSPMTVHSLPYDSSPMPQMYPYSSGLVPAPPLRAKRRQVKNACTKCQKACKKCDDCRPCLRCVRYGIADECVDSSARNARKVSREVPTRSAMQKVHRAGNVDIDVPINGAPYSPTSYVPGYYSQYPPSPPPGKPGDSPTYYHHHTHPHPQYFFTTMSYSPPPSPHAETADENAYPPLNLRTALLSPSYVMSLPDASVSMGGHHLYQLPQT
ncbi:hypothetical protein BDZ89DRAFT_1067109 [Hymenopellis radicata]|nr:hypothetical protein BDZ89DRAFT_1067109 [Hymenopellis radicata]